MTYSPTHPLAARLRALREAIDEGKHPMEPITKTAFANALRTALVKNNAWAQDAERLARFVQASLNGEANIDSESFAEAWKAVGGKGRLTYKAIKALT